MKDYSTIIRQIVTEKSSTAQAQGQYTFAVRKDATKIDVKNAIKSLYGADVQSVRISILPSKKRLIGRGRLFTKRPVTKKATVRLKKGATIDPSKLKKAKASTK